MKVKSHYPPFCFESPVTGKKWIVCTGKGSQWIEVDRFYSWKELEKLWQKIEYGFTKPLEEKSKLPELSLNTDNLFAISLASSLRPVTVSV